MRWLDDITDSMDMSLSKTPEDSEGQGSLACCSLWGHKDLDMTQGLNKFLKNPIVLGQPKGQKEMMENLVTIVITIITLLDSYNSNNYSNITRYFTRQVRYSSKYYIYVSSFYPPTIL